MLFFSKSIFLKNNILISCLLIFVCYSKNKVKLNNKIKIKFLNQ